MNKTVFSLVFSGIIMLMPGCATFDGMRADARRMLSDDHDVQAPASVCESIYRREGANQKYQKCLEQVLMARTSPDERQFGKTYPECEKIYRSKTGKLKEYRSCQEEAYRKHVVLPEVQKIVQQKKSAARRGA